MNLSFRFKTFSGVLVSPKFSGRLSEAVTSTD